MIFDQIRRCSDVGFGWDLVGMTLWYPTKSNVETTSKRRVILFDVGFGQAYVESFDQIQRWNDDQITKFEKQPNDGVKRKYRPRQAYFLLFSKSSCSSQNISEL